MMETFGRVASGDINPSRFVMPISSTAFAAAQATAGSKIVGISHEGTRRFDATLCASDGEGFRVYGEGEHCLLELGGTVVADDFLVPDADGKGVTADLTATANPVWVGARAAEGGASGNKIRVTVKVFSTIDN